MANYYDLISFEVPMTGEQLQWAEDDLDRRLEYDGLDFANPANRYPNALVTSESSSYGFAPTKPTNVWITHDDGLDVDALCDWLHGIMHRFDILGAWAFEISYDCSKPRLDAYGGCGVVITRHGIESMSTRRWLEERMDALDIAADVGNRFRERLRCDPCTTPNPNI